MRTSFSRKSLYSERGCWKKSCSGGFVLSCRRVCWLPVGQSSCGGCSGRENRKKRNTHDQTRKGGNRVNQFVKHLKRCAVCGSTPKIHYVYEHGHHYKLFCSKNAVHNSTGEWFSNKYQACLDWNARQQVRKVAKQKENLQLLHSKRSLLFRGQQRRKGEKEKRFV